MTAPSQDALIDYAPSQAEEVGRPKSRVINEVTLKLKEDDGQFIVDIRQSKEDGKPTIAGYYAGWPTIEQAIDRALDILKQHLTPRGYDTTTEVESEEGEE